MNGAKLLYCVTVGGENGGRGRQEFARTHMHTHTLLKSKALCERERETGRRKRRSEEGDEGGRGGRGGMRKEMKEEEEE